MTYKDKIKLINSKSKDIGYVNSQIVELFESLGFTFSDDIQTSLDMILEDFVLDLLYKEEV